MKIIHLITGLGLGGAETMLYRLLNEYRIYGDECKVISLISGGEYVDTIRMLGVPVYELNMKKNITIINQLFMLSRLLRQEKPDIVHSWMYHSDLLLALNAIFLKRFKTIWGIHHANLEPACNRRTTILIAKLCAYLSYMVPDKIICCSEASLRVHRDLGYRHSIMRVVPNGYDAEVFSPQPKVRNAMRSHFNISENVLVIGLIARYHPLKDYDNFLYAAQIFIKHNSRVKFILCGKGVDYSNDTLVDSVYEKGLNDYALLLGQRDDINRVIQAFDIGTLSSSGEGFPNVLCEMMLSGIPCVSTDVGDAVKIIGDTGIVVPPKNSSALANGWNRLSRGMQGEGYTLKEKARDRIIRKYSIGTICKRYHDIYAEVCKRN